MRRGTETQKHHIIPAGVLDLRPAEDDSDNFGNKNWPRNACSPRPLAAQPELLSARGCNGLIEEKIAVGSTPPSAKLDPYQPREAPSLGVIDSPTNSRKTNLRRVVRDRFSPSERRVTPPRRSRTWSVSRPFREAKYRLRTTPGSRDVLRAAKPNCSIEFGKKNKSSSPSRSRSAVQQRVIGAASPTPHVDSPSEDASNAASPVQIRRPRGPPGPTARASRFPPSPAPQNGRRRTFVRRREAATESVPRPPRPADRTRG